MHARQASGVKGALGERRGEEKPAERKKREVASGKRGEDSRPEREASQSSQQNPL